ncbi:MAG: hypothetical protein MI976_30285 [Pseudomonadales bacterium]|nr:hypothetical protein [Pseudomonadales bacterium]
MARHGLSLFFTLLVSISLAGCFGGGNTSKATDNNGADRGSASSNLENDLDITDAFSVDAGPRYIFADGGSELELTGSVSSSGVSIVESYWRTFDPEDGFVRIEGSAIASAADNVYVLNVERQLEDFVQIYQFVAKDSKGRAALDTVYIKVSPVELAFTAFLESESVVEGQPFVVEIFMPAPLAEDLTLEFSFESGTAVIGEDVADCDPCNIVIPAGEVSASIAVTPISDNLVEGEETFRVLFASFAEAFGEEAFIELTILDHEIVALPVLSVLTDSITVQESDGVATIPVSIEGDFEPVDEVVTATLVFEEGSADASDYTEVTTPVIRSSESGLYIQVAIINDTESEDTESFLVRIVGDEQFAVSESNRVEINIESDDVGLMASANESYCAVQDGIGLRCWGDFVYGKTMPPLMGTISKLVGAADYYCAIHSDDGARRMSCWGDVPGDITEIAGPDDVVALQDQVCTLIDGEVTCYGANGGAVFATGAEAIVGGVDVICALGTPEAPTCISFNQIDVISDVVATSVQGDNPVLAAVSPDTTITDLLPTADQLMGGYFDLGEGGASIACARSGADVVCSGLALESTLSLQASALAMFNYDYQVLICAIETTAVGSELVCFNQSDQAIFPFANIAITNPYALSSDLNTNLCVAHEDGVDCLRNDADFTEYESLVSLDTQLVSKIDAGLVTANNYNSVYALCGMQDEILTCDQPDFTDDRQDQITPDEGSVVDFSMGSALPVFTLDNGSVSFVTYINDGIGTANWGVTNVDTSMPPVRGYSFMCANFPGSPECYNYYQSSINPEPGVTVANPDSLAANDTEVCALVAGEVLCWEEGDPASRQEIPTNHEPLVALAMKGSSGCASTDAELYCWGGLARYLPEPVTLNVGAVSDLAVSDQRVCVMGATGLQCWVNGNREVFELNFTEVADITVSNEFACLLEEEKVRCWGDYPDYDVVNAAAN